MITRAHACTHLGPPPKPETQTEIATTPEPRLSSTCINYAYEQEELTSDEQGTKYLLGDTKALGLQPWAHDDQSWPN